MDTNIGSGPTRVVYKDTQVDIRLDASLSYYYKRTHKESGHIFIGMVPNINHANHALVPLTTQEQALHDYVLSMNNKWGDMWQYEILNLQEALDLAALVKR